MFNRCKLYNSTCSNPLHVIDFILFCVMNKGVAFALRQLIQFSLLAGNREAKTILEFPEVTNMHVNLIHRPRSYYLNCELHEGLDSTFPLDCIPDRKIKWIEIPGVNCKTSGYVTSARFPGGRQDKLEHAGAC